MARPRGERRRVTRWQIGLKNYTDPAVPRMMSARILVVDGSDQMRRVLRASLVQIGCTVYDANSGEEVLELARETHPDLIVLDTELAGISGLEACRRIRQTSTALIVVLTARKSDQDKVAALDAGADDYVTKPFSMPELIARIRAHLRRAPGQSLPARRVVKFDEVEINFTMRTVSVGGRAKRLTPKEFELLSYLVAHPNTALPRARLLQAVWGPEYTDDAQYLHVYIQRLRTKIEPDQTNPRYIVTDPWYGYRFNLPE